MSAAVRLLPTLALVVLSLVILLAHSDLSLDLESVSTNILSHVVFVCARCFVAARDGVDTVKLVGQLRIVGRGVSVRTGIVLSCSASSEALVSQMHIAALASDGGSHADLLLLDTACASGWLFLKLLFFSCS